MKKIIFIFSFLFLTFLFKLNAFAYDTPTHSFLTNTAIDFYNAHFPQNPIPQEFRSYLLEGAVREDDAPRWLNHFYDPVYQRGLTYDPKIDVLNIGSWMPSKKWAHDKEAQNSIFYKGEAFLSSLLSSLQKQKFVDSFSNTDFTWETALDLYVSGKKEDAMFALGHILHLIEDASVPDHTRNDPHLDGSPYENYARRYTLQNPDKELSQRLNGKNPIILSNLDSYFDGIASYSNYNFYSKDTIGIQSGYQNPLPDLTSIALNGSSTYLTFQDGEGNKYFLVKTLLPLTFLGLKDLKFSINDEQILSSYWKLLSTKAVEYAAGVLDLFFKEAQKLALQKSSEMTAALVQKIPEKSKFSSSTTQTAGGGPVVFINQSVFKNNEPINVYGKNFTPNGKVNIFFVSPLAQKNTLSVYADSRGEIKSVYSLNQKPLGVYTYYAYDLQTNSFSNQVLFSVVEETSVNNQALKATATTSVVNISTSTNKVSFNLTTSTTSTVSSNTLKSSSNFSEVTQSVKKCVYNENFLPSHQKLIFNEIAWMGGSEDYGLNSSDEWIEIKNLTGNELNLSGFQIVSKRGSIHISFPTNSKIGPFGFYLLERTDDNSVPNIKADLIYAGSLANSDDGLELFDNNCNLLDKVVADPDWPAGDAALKRTMERDNNFSWYTSGSFNGKIFGTPKNYNGPRYIPANNTTYIYVGGTNTNNNSQNSNSQNSSNQSTSTQSTSTQSTSTLDFSKIIISEIMYNYPGGDTGNEWIEIQNTGLDEIDISALKFLEGGTAHNLSKILGSNILRPGEFAVIANSTSTFLNNFPNFSGNLFFASFSLSNSGEEIALKFQDLVFSNVSYLSSLGANGDGNSLQLIDGAWIWSYPTPGSANFFNQLHQVSENGSSTANVAGSQALNVVISEVQVGGKDAGDEFIELYNSTDQEVNLGGWSLQYLSGSADLISSSTLSKKNFESGSIIKPHRFFLIARGVDENNEDGYQGKILPDLTYRSFSLSEGSEGGAIFLVATTSFLSSFEDKNIISSVFYGNGQIFGSYNPSPVPKNNQSLQRKSFENGLCISALAGTGKEFFPKNCLIGFGESAQEFEISENPHPSNFQSLPEPRIAPQTPGPFPGKNQVAYYDYENASIHFYWVASRDSENSPSGIVYKIFGEDDNGEEYLISATTSLEFSYDLPEIGKNYKFSLIAYDRDGMPSNPLNLSLNTPFLNNFSILFSNGVLKSTSYGSFFSDNWYNLGRGFSGVLKALTLRGFIDDVHFLSSSVTLEEYEDENYTHLINSYLLSGDVPFTNLPRTVKIENLNIQLNPYSFYRLLTYQNHQNRSVILFGDNSRGQAMSNTFIVDRGRIFNYYTFYPFILMEGEKSPEVDVSILQKPTTPQILATNFDKFGMTLNILWSTSTDLDSLDDRITYEINYTTLSDFNPNEWINVGKTKEYLLPLVFPNKYKIGVRAVDEGGLYSEIEMFEWEFPSDFYPYLVSEKYNLATQEFVLSKDVNLSSITVFTKDFSTQSGYLYGDFCNLTLENVDGGYLLATADNEYSGPGCGNSPTFSFQNSNLQLKAGKKYRWKFSLSVGWANVKFYGRNENIVGGYFSGVDLKNAAFEILSSQGEIISSDNGSFFNINNINPNPETAEINLEISNSLGFSPSSFIVTKGSKVTINLISTDDQTHVLKFDPPLDSVNFGVGPFSSRTIKFDAPSNQGEYTFHDDVPGHQNLTGKMIVQ